MSSFTQDRLGGEKGAAAPLRQWLPRSALSVAIRVALPIVSILLLWYGAILWSGLPAFVLPRPERVAQTLFAEWRLIALHLWFTLQVAAIGFVTANLVGIGLAVLFIGLPVGRLIVMPSAITLRNIPYVALVSVLALAMGDGTATKVAVVTIAGFFPVLVNAYRGLQSVDPIVLDRMRILDATWWDVFSKVRLPYSIPYIVAAQEITGTASIVVAIAVEWMISRTGLGYVINLGMMQYRGDIVYAVALVAALVSFGIYTLIHYFGERLDWNEGSSVRK
jgi:NitT/TauT family transport system permease protein